MTETDDEWLGATALAGLRGTGFAVGRVIDWGEGGRKGEREREKERGRGRKRKGEGEGGRESGRGRER